MYWLFIVSLLTFLVEVLTYLNTSNQEIAKMNVFGRLPSVCIKFYGTRNLKHKEDIT